MSTCAKHARGAELGKEGRGGGRGGQDARRHNPGDKGRFFSSSQDDGTRVEEGIPLLPGDEEGMRMGQRVEEGGRHNNNNNAVGTECTKAEEESEEKQENKKKTNEEDNE